MKKCENCEKDHKGDYGSGRFCSSKCARGFSTKSKRKEINEKISRSIKNKLKNGETVGFAKPLKEEILHICTYQKCNKQFYSKKENRKYCSSECQAKDIGWSNVHKTLKSEDWSKLQKRLYAEGIQSIGGGKTKWYRYKNIKVQGTFELRTCFILDKMKEVNEIYDWEYTNDRITYTNIKGKPSSYLIDFKVYLDENQFYYLEIKGFVKDNDYLKWKAVTDQGFNLKVWKLKEIEYNENKYHLLRVRVPS